MKIFFSIILILLGLVFFSCDSKNHIPQKSSTQSMVDTLQSIVENTDPLKNYYVNDLRAKYYESKLPTATPREKGLLLYTIFKELINGGRNQDAINRIQSFVNQQGLDINNMTNNTRLIFELLGLAYLRDGEINNCIKNHNAQSCIMPLGEMGLHTDKNGSQKAIEIFEKILTKFPENHNARWLINVAYMTLGEYPQGVPASFLIKGLDDKNKASLIPLDNAATGMGIDVNKTAGGVCIDDFNNDGYLDIFTSSYGITDDLQVFYSDQKGGYKNVSDATGLKGITGGLNMVHADYNNDGFLDVFVLRGAWFGESGNHPNSLIKNNGDGTFTDVTYDTGLLSFSPTQAATWADFNNDGWIDLYIANETVDPKSPQKNELFINENGKFTNVAQTLGLDIFGYYKGVSSGDINNDGWTDIYVTNLNGDNYLFLNTTPTTGKLSFKNITKSAKVGNPFSSFPTWFWDYNNDGWVDIFASSYDTKGLQKVGHMEALHQMGLGADLLKPCLYKNNGDNTFTNTVVGTELERVMFPMGANFGDLDNDGFLDMYLGTGAPDLRSIVPNLVFHNKGGEKFEDITYSSGMAHIQKGHAIAFADLDNDGDQDVYLVAGGAYSGDNFHNALFENKNEKHNWITLKLEGTKTNRAAIGSRIKIEAEDDKGEIINFYRIVGTGGSFGASSLQEEIGIGKATKINTIEITWANKDQDKQEFKNPKPNAIYKITEGQESLEQIEVNKVTFKQSAEGGHHHH